MSSITAVVIRRARRIYHMRRLSVLALPAMLSVLMLYAIGREVWVGRVIENMPTLVDIPATCMFLVNAVVATETVVQGLLLALVLSAGWLTREFLRYLGQGATPMLRRA
jgi:hypothetical protein